MNAIEVERVSKIYRRYAYRRQFSTLKSALLKGSLVSDLKPGETFAALADVSLTAPAGTTFGIIGRNGSGKSTLLKLVAHATEADAGRVTVGASVKLGYFAQHSMELLDPHSSVWDMLIGKFPKASVGSLKTLAGVFGFPGEDVEKPCKILSGGEKARLVLALMLYDPPNFLVLDEPTNHLDIATKEMLIEALAGYDGTMLFVSHDRHFLRLLSNRVLEVSNEGVRSFGGGYAEYVDEVGYEAPGMRS